MSHVTVYRSLDALEAEQLTDLLCSEELDARHIGTRNAALIGVGSGILEQRIEVARRDEERARILVDAFLASFAHGAAADDEDGEDDGDEPPAERRGEARPLRPRKPVMAIGAALFVPGGGHFYARRPLGGALVAIGLVGGVAWLVSLEWTARPERIATGVSLAALWLADVIGGLRGVADARRGRRPSWLRQVEVPAIALLVVVPAAFLGAPHLPPPSPPALEQAVHPPLDPAFEPVFETFGQDDVDLLGVPSGAVDLALPGLAPREPIPAPPRVGLAVHAPVTPPDLTVGDGRWQAGDDIRALAVNPDGSIDAATSLGWTRFAPDGTPHHRVDTPALAGLSAGGPWLIQAEANPRVLHRETRTDVPFLDDGAELAGIALDGSALAVLRDSQVTTFGADGDLRFEAPAPFLDVRALRPRADGSVLVVGDTRVAWLPVDGEPRVVDLPCAGGAPVDDLAVLRGCTDGTVALALPSLERRWTLDGHGTAMALAANGDLVLADNGQIRWVDAAGRPTREVTVPSAHFIEAIAVDGERVYFPDGPTVRALDPGTSLVPVDFRGAPRLVGRSGERWVVAEDLGAVALIDATGERRWLADEAVAARVLDTGEVVVETSGEVAVYDAAGERVATHPWWFRADHPIPGRAAWLSAYDAIHIVEALSGAAAKLEGTDGAFVGSIWATGDGAVLFARFPAPETPTELALWSADTGAALDALQVGAPWRGAAPLPTGIRLEMEDGSHRAWRRDAAGGWTDEAIDPPTWAFGDGALGFGLDAGTPRVVTDLAGNPMRRIDVGDVSIERVAITREGVGLSTADGRLFVYRLDVGAPSP